MKKVKTIDTKNDNSLLLIASNLITVISSVLYAFGQSVILIAAYEVVINDNSYIKIDTARKFIKLFGLSYLSFGVFLIVLMILNHLTYKKKNKLFQYILFAIETLVCCYLIFNIIRLFI